MIPVFLELIAPPTIAIFVFTIHRDPPKTTRQSLAVGCLFALAIAGALWI